MKREQLASLGIDRELIERIMALPDAGRETDGVRQARREAERWKARCTALEEQAALARYRKACDDAAAALNFSCASARETFLRRLGEATLPRDGEHLATREYGAFLEAFGAQDPGAFAEYADIPRFVDATPGAAPFATDRRAAANDALRALLQKD